MVRLEAAVGVGSVPRLGSIGTSLEQSISGWTSWRATRAAASAYGTADPVTPGGSSLGQNRSTGGRAVPES
jgi:hypothetical protein